MTGPGFLLAMFIASFIYALSKSRNKWKAALLILGAVGILLGISLAIGYSRFATPAEMGTLAGLVLPITGIAASFIVAKKEQK